MNKPGYVYIVTNRPNGTLYIGVTSDLIKRVYEHKEKLADGFTEQYGLDKLVYFETYECMEDAIHREKCMKEWQRAWKIKRIVEQNPDWHDLYEEIC